MDAHDMDHDMDQMREFKVQIPLALHFQLHRTRLLQGQSISTTMRMALDRYLEGRTPEDMNT